MTAAEEIREIGICGATATGKSALAILLAERLGGEIVSCDSMQIYKGMDIGTAKPTREELARVPHHMIGFLDPGTAYSCAQYVQDAQKVIDDIKSRGKIPIVCGGTGLYLESVYYRNRFSDSDTSPTEASAKRDELLSYAREFGNDALHKRLRDIDPEAAAAIHPSNTRRVARAIEIYETTGTTKTEWDKKSRNGEHVNMTVIMLQYKERASQQRAIKVRCRKMIEDGLEYEVRELYNAGLITNGKTAGQAIGYKEFIPYFSGLESVRAAQDKFFHATCRYAKHQETWFRHKEYVNRIYVDDVISGKLTMEEVADTAALMYSEKRDGDGDSKQSDAE